MVKEGKKEEGKKEEGKKEEEKKEEEKPEKGKWKIFQKIIYANHLYCTISVRTTSAVRHGSYCNNGIYSMC